jgi:hypothetical protein
MTRFVATTAAGFATLQLAGVVDAQENPRGSKATAAR